jgi:hypothetical protein
MCTTNQFSNVCSIDGLDKTDVGIIGLLIREDHAKLRFFYHLTFPENLTASYYLDVSNLISFHFSLKIPTTNLFASPLFEFTFEWSILKNTT